MSSVLKADLDHVWHPLTQHKKLAEHPPKVMVKGRGATITDSAGNDYLDGMAGLWCVNVGYGRSEIAEAVYEQLLELPYYPHTQANPPASQLAERLAELTGGEPGRSYFVNSGTEANEAAFKLARQYQRQQHPNEPRHKTVSRYLSYHGTSLSTLAAGAFPERKSKFEPLPGDVVHVPPVYCYRCPFGLSYPSCDLACAKQVEYAIQSEGPETVGAVVVEPVSSAVGVLVPPPEYLPEVAAACKRHGVLLIVDEVINGFGRTGAWFAHQHFEVTPDLLCIAKGLTSGYQPLGAVMATTEVFDAFLGEPGENKEALQVNTWGGHAAACAGALSNLEIMTKEELPRRAAETGAYLLEQLRGLLELPVVGEVRGLGLLIALELVEDKESKVPLSGARVVAVVRSCLERGVIVGRSAGSGAGLGNCVVLAPPLVLTEAEADQIVAVLGAALQEP
jgi:adenosylmethionine-8-amino-7-oxononanoate aminotransferase